MPNKYKFKSWWKLEIFNISFFNIKISYSGKQTPNFFKLWNFSSKFSILDFWLKIEENNYCNLQSSLLNIWINWRDFLISVDFNFFTWWENLEKLGIFSQFSFSYKIYSQIFKKWLSKFWPYSFVFSSSFLAIILFI